MSDSVLERANEIMESAVQQAGELLCTKPLVAEIILKQLLRCDPEHLAGLQLLGLCKQRLGKNAEAVEIIQTALDLDPNNADNYNNLGLAYGGMGNFDRAIEAIQKAIELKPDQFLFKNNLSLQYRAKGDYENAVKTMRAGIEQSPQPQMWINLGSIYGELRDIDEAQKCFEKAIRIDPEYPAAYVDLAFACHFKGDWKKGFAAAEWRFWYYPQLQYYLNAYDMSKLWDGKASLEGKRVLVYGEQGLGDIIQFSRYCKELKRRGAYVILHCPVSLDSLLRRLDGVDETTNRDIVNRTDGEFPEYDYQFSSMSFPHLLDIEKISGEPYIEPATTKFKDYMKKEYGDTFNVGIIWAGSPAHPNDRKRSIPLKYFRPLHQTEGVKLFSLQVDAQKRQYGATMHNAASKKGLQEKPVSQRFQPSDEIVDYCEDSEDIKLVDLTTMIQSFEDTATILVGLDLVICCDTAVAHLAGAMGVPCWIAIPYNPDWRWGYHSNKTHWYNSLRVFRQEERDDWESVFRNIQKELHATVLQNQR